LCEKLADTPASFLRFHRTCPPPHLVRAPVARRNRHPWTEADALMLLQLLPIIGRPLLRRARAAFGAPPSAAPVTPFTIEVADERHLHVAEQVAREMESSAQVRGTGIARRSPEYLREKMREGKAVIAFDAAGAWAGFCYIESWSHGRFVANSGLIVAPAYRHSGLARGIKRRIFSLSRRRYPQARLFGLTTGLAVMKINSELGYIPVTYSELTDDDQFWQGCTSCVNYEILVGKERRNCLCTAMLYDPARPLRRHDAGQRSGGRAQRLRGWLADLFSRAPEER
jgi:hypothetical protein